jgi:hypothetical protein
LLRMVSILLLSIGVSKIDKRTKIRRRTLCLVYQLERIPSAQPAQRAHQTATTGSGMKKILQEGRKDLAPSKFGVDSDSCK